MGISHIGIGICLIFIIVSGNSAENIDQSNSEIGNKGRGTVESPDRIAPEPKNKTEKLAVAVYYQTLCEYSKDFFRDQLIPVWNLLGEEYLDLRLIPYGNAHTFFQPGFIMTGCQHGEMECYGNKVHACALEYLPKNVSRNFIFCSMSLDSPADAVKNCSVPHSHYYDFQEKVMDACVDGIAGDLALALKGLQSLDFVGDGVPSVAVNGVVAEGDGPYDDFLSYICEMLLNPPSKTQSQGFEPPTPCRKRMSES